MLMSLHCMPDVLATQLINRVFFLVDCHLFNAMLTFPPLCTCGNAFHLKMQLSLLEEWATDMSHFWVAAAR
jgi:hypothetical protein